MSGFVTFVSAGPGDPGLLTLRAAERLRTAQVVLYDDLASGPVLSMTAPGAVLVPVGKRAGRPSARQEDVNRLLVEHASMGAQVARLKSGDSGIFGRLEEEMLALSAAGIRYEIVPGVSAASAAAAAAGLPLTRRLTARRVQFVTGADVTGTLPQALNWAALADPDATTVVYMGRRSFPALAEGLIAHGLAPSTPALLAEAVGHEAQRLVRSTIGELARLLAESGSPHPALILYGPLMEPPGLTPQGRSA